MVTTATDPDGSVSLDGLTLRTPGIRGAVSVERVAPPDASAREAPPRALSRTPGPGAPPAADADLPARDRGGMPGAATPAAGAARVARRGAGGDPRPSRSP